MKGGRAPLLGQRRGGGRGRVSLGEIHQVYKKIEKGEGPEEESAET